MPENSLPEKDEFWLRGGPAHQKVAASLHEPYRIRAALRIKDHMENLREKPWVYASTLRYLREIGRRDPELAMELVRGAPLVRSIRQGSRKGRSP